MKIHKRPFLLLEVMIAFGLVVLCALPLIYPHTYILRAQKEFLQEIELDHYVNNHYAELVELLYKNQVPWNVISGKTPILLNPPNSGLTGTVAFEEENHKPNDSNYTVFLFKITYSFSNGLKYPYQLMIIRDLAAEQIGERLDNNAKDAESENP